MNKEQFSTKMINITNDINQVMDEFLMDEKNPNTKSTIIRALTLLLIKKNLTYSEQLDLCDYCKEQTIKHKNTQLI